MSEKTLTEKINQGRQYRSMNVMEVRTEGEEDKFIVEGYATTFNEPYTLYDSRDWEYREQVDPEAFRECDMSDTIAQFDHTGKVYARTSNGTLQLSVDEHGLKVHMNLGGTTIGRELYEEIKGGYITKMSFGFTVEEDEELRTSEGNKEVWLRTIRKIGKLYDVSVVSIPANDGTEVSARSLVDGVIAKRSQEIEEQKRKEEEAKKAEAEAKAKEERERLRLHALALI
ncbi:MAG: HK97 family phage prohead protease [Oscillospiraceae bacterium]|jgi:hypothetical protein